MFITHHRPAKEGMADSCLWPYSSRPPPPPIPPPRMFMRVHTCSRAPGHRDLRPRQGTETARLQRPLRPHNSSDRTAKHRPRGDVLIYIWGRAGNKSRKLGKEGGFCFTIPKEKQFLTKSILHFLFPRILKLVGDCPREKPLVVVGGGVCVCLCGGGSGSGFH